MKDSQINPFYVRSPEGLDADTVCSLFEDSFSDYPSLLEQAHIFLIGPRGTGKSMMFRYMMPDCQTNKSGASELNFFSTYVPLKRQNFNISELARLENAYASVVINEHLLTAFVARLFFSQLEKHFGLEKIDSVDTSVFTNCLEIVGQRGLRLESSLSAFEVLKKFWADLYNHAIDYLKTIAFSGPSSYTQKLVNYLDHLLPTMVALRESSLLNGVPVFLLMDDAHNLSKEQTQILNGWVATRTSSEVALKISTQPNYKTFFTTTGERIERPHDYSETRTAEVYTAKNKGRYYKKISGIVERRLRLAGLKLSPQDFFPVDEKQESQITSIADNYRDRHRRGEGRGNRPSDDAVRYARPEYIKSLGGAKKSSSQYSYAGFDQLVHISAGVTRHFLDCASKMFDEEIASERLPVKFIMPLTQNSVVREEANELKFRVLGRDASDSDSRSLTEDDIVRVRNLIDCLGGAFRLILLSDRSERRVYSVAFSDEPSKRLRDTLAKCVDLGFLSESSIGKKGSGVGGRTQLYILTRRLAPHWTLDPTGFAGYLFTTSSALEAGLENPNAFLRRFDSEGMGGDTVIEQLELFQE